MVQEGDKIAVCISGGKDSMLLAKCMQELKRHRQMNFDLEFIVKNFKEYLDFNLYELMFNIDYNIIFYYIFENDFINDKNQK